MRNCCSFLLGNNAAEAEIWSNAKGVLRVLLQDKGVGCKQGSEFGSDVVWSVGTYPFCRKDDIPYMMENKKWLKPPTRLCNDDIYLMSNICFFDINLSNL